MDYAYECHLAIGVRSTVDGVWFPCCMVRLRADALFFICHPCTPKSFTIRNLVTGAELGVVEFAALSDEDSYRWTSRL